MSGKWDELKAFEKMSGEVDELVEMCIALNKIRTNGSGVLSNREMGASVDNVKSKLGMKENEFKQLLEKVISMLEIYSSRYKGEFNDILEEMPKEVSPLIKKVIGRLVKAGVFSNEYSNKEYDWHIEKETNNSSNSTESGNNVILRISSIDMQNIEKVNLKLTTPQFYKLHETLSKLRETTLTLLN